MGNKGKTEKDDVFKVLKNVYDPDYYMLNKSIVDLGLIQRDDVKITRKKITIEYDLEAPFCVFGSALGVMIKYAVEKKLNKQADVKLKPSHPQSEAVNLILQNARECERMLKKLDCHEVLKWCVRI